MNTNNWGGAREGAGRPRKGERPNVPHRPREEFHFSPIFVTYRMERGICDLRRQRPFNAVKRSLQKAAKRFKTRIIHFAVLGNHIHLVLESLDPRTLSQAMKGLGGRIAKALNKVMNRHGQVIADRYHSSIVRTVRGARKVIRYVRENFRKHFGVPGEWRTGVSIDPCSSWAHVVMLPEPKTVILRNTDPFW